MAKTKNQKLRVLLKIKKLLKPSKIDRLRALAYVKNRIFSIVVVSVYVIFCISCQLKKSQKTIFT